PCPKPLLRLDLHIPSLVYDKARTHAWRARAANRRWKSDPAARPRSVQVLVARAGCDRFGLILLIRLDIGREERLAHRRGIISTGFHQRLRALQRRNGLGKQVAALARQFFDLLLALLNFGIGELRSLGPQRVIQLIDPLVDVDGL